MSRAAKAPRKLLERDIQKQVKHLLALAGCVVYDTSQGWRKDPGGTRMTPGLPDLLVFLPMAGPTHIPGSAEAFKREWAHYSSPLIGFIEVKTEEGLKDHARRLAKRERRAVAQDHFGQLCRERGIPYALGGVEATWAFLASVGLAERERTPQIVGALYPHTEAQWLTKAKHLKRSAQRLLATGDVLTPRASKSRSVASAIRQTLRISSPGSSATS